MSRALYPRCGHSFGVADASGFVRWAIRRESTWSYSRQTVQVPINLGSRPQARSRAKRSSYSYLSASTGSSFEAFNAGIMPLNIPTKSNTTADPSTAIAEMRK